MCVRVYVYVRLQKSLDHGHPSNISLPVLLTAQRRRFLLESIVYRKATREEFYAKNAAEAEAATKVRTADVSVVETRSVLCAQTRTHTALGTLQ